MCAGRALAAWSAGRAVGCLVPFQTRRWRGRGRREKSHSDFIRRPGRNQERPHEHLPCPLHCSCCCRARLGQARPPGGGSERGTYCTLTFFVRTTEFDSIDCTEYIQYNTIILVRAKDIVLLHVRGINASRGGSGQSVPGRARLLQLETGVETEGYKSRAWLLLAQEGDEALTICWTV